MKLSMASNDGHQNNIRVCCCTLGKGYEVFNV